MSTHQDDFFEGAASRVNIKMMQSVHAKGSKDFGRNLAPPLMGGRENASKKFNLFCCAESFTVCRNKKLYSLVDEQKETHELSKSGAPDGIPSVQTQYILKSRGW